jgi:hypothetical protein
MKTPNPSRASLVRYSIYKINRISNKQLPCLTPLPIFILLVSLWSCRTSALWSMFNMLIKLLSHQSIPVSFRICFNPVSIIPQMLHYHLHLRAFHKQEKWVRSEEHLRQGNFLENSTVLPNYLHIFVAIKEHEHKVIVPSLLPSYEYLQPPSNCKPCVSPIPFSTRRLHACVSEALKRHHKEVTDTQNSDGVVNRIVRHCPALAILFLAFTSKYLIRHVTQINGFKHSQIEYYLYMHLFSSLPSKLGH